MDPIEILLSKDFNVSLVSFSSIDLYLKNNYSKSYIYAITNAEVVDIAKLFDNPEFGYNFFHISIKHKDSNFLFFSIKNGNNYPNFPFAIQFFTFDIKKDKFKNIYSSFNHIKRKETIFINNRVDLNTLLENAKLISKYNIKISNLTENDYTELTFTPLSSKIQKELLLSILESNYPEKGFDFLLKTGFVEFYWQELFRMTHIEQIKDYHPEGNVWQHTMETFKYVRKKNIILNTALLFHDVGKAFTSPYKKNRFYKHAQIGANITEKFLKKLGFNNDFIEKVKILVEFHMLPEAIERMPESKLRQIKDKVDLNLLFELYRADISSSYKELNYYYKAKSLINKI